LAYKLVDEKYYKIDH